MYGDGNDEWQKQQEIAARAYREREEAAAHSAKVEWDRQQAEAAQGWQQFNEVSQRSATEYADSVRDTLRQAHVKQHQDAQAQEAWEAKERAHKAHHESSRQGWATWLSSGRNRKRQTIYARETADTRASTYPASGGGSALGLFAGLVIIGIGVLIMFALAKDSLFHPSRPAPVTTTVSFADFSTPSITADHIRISPRAGFQYNAQFPNNPSWRMVSGGGGFTGTFVVSAAGQYDLVVTHLTSYALFCPGSGYSPVTIRVNSNTIAANYDAAANHGGTHDMVTDRWPIMARAGTNTLQWIYERSACTHYWIQRIEVQSVTDSGER
jgi:hypothetical protein